MFETLRNNTEFLAVSDRDALVAMISGQSSDKALPAKDLGKVTKNIREFENHARLDSELRRCTQFIVVRRHTLRFIGVVRNPGGLPQVVVRYDLAKSAPAIRGDLVVFACFWSDSIFWKKFVVSAIYNNKIGDDYWMQQVEQEQRRMQTTTNRDGWVNGDTWAMQDQTGRERAPFSGGGHRGTPADAEDVRSRNFVNV